MNAIKRRLSRISAEVESKTSSDIPTDNRPDEMSSCEDRASMIVPDNRDGDAAAEIATKAETRRSLQVKSGRVTLARHLLKRQVLSINSISAVKIKTLLAVIHTLLLSTCLVQAGFWTFYFPNFLKSTGFNEVTDIIKRVESKINESIDMFQDVQYYWGLMQDFDKIDKSQLYPEESACEDLFPIFRDLAIEYAHIDYDMYMGPMLEYSEHLKEYRETVFPAGLDTKATLPREWEQKLYENELEFKIEWHSRLTEEQKYKDLRQKMIEIWKTARRGLDSSLPCLYLRYAYHQMAEDISQQALESNLEGMKKAMTMVKDAYKRIEKFKSSDQSARDLVAEEIQKMDRFTIRKPHKSS